VKFLLQTLFAVLLAFPLVAQHGQSGRADQAQGVGYSPNLGQFPEHVLAFTPFAGGYLFAENDGLTFSLYSRPAHGKDAEQVVHHVYKQAFIGAQSEQLHVVDQQPEDWTRNFFLGNNPLTHRSGVPVFQSVRMQDLYQGIQLELTQEYGNLKTNFYVHPGSDPAQIQWLYKHAEARLVNGHLEIPTPSGEMQEMKPVAWTLDAKGKKHRVKVKYVQEGDVFGFQLGAYDPAHVLVIDPVLVFSSYSGSTSDNWGFTATYDNLGHAYGGGIVAGAGYPVSPEAAQTEYGGGSWDIAVMKFMPDGMDIEYASYLGGAGNDVPSSMVVDSQNRLVVFGTTGSQDFPTTEGAFDSTHNGGPFTAPLGTVDFVNGADFYVSRFSANGSALDASTYMGGEGTDGINEDFDFNYGDLFRAEVIVDASDRVICAGTTTSSDLPTAGMPYSDVALGGQDAALFMLNDDFSNLEWSTYFGGLLDDTAYALEVMGDGSVFVVGSTQSVDLPAGENAVYNDFQGDLDGYVAHFESGTLVNCTFMGTSDYDRTFFIEQDTDGNIWITGQSEGEWPLVNETYVDQGAGQYFVKLNPELSEMLLSTTYGSEGIFSPINICQTAFLVDDCNRIFVAGWGGALNFSFGDTNDMPVTGDAFQSTTDGSDFYLAAFDVDVGSQLYGSFIGGNGLNEHVDGGTSRFSPDGTVYQAVCAGCGGSSLFPSTDGAFNETNASTNCNLAVFKFDFEIQSLTAVASASPSPQGCTPFTVTFNNAGSTGIESYWEFGTGDSSTDDAPTYTYTEPGIFEVMYVSTDPGSCNVSDTTYLEVEVQDPLLLTPAFTWFAPLCQEEALVTFDYTGGTEYDELIWNYGDGNGSDNTGTFEYLYAAGGNYTVTVTLTDEFCNEQVTATQQVFVDPQGGVEGEVVWPNIFTPNQDEFNRYFQPFIELDNGTRLVPTLADYADVFELLELQVFNRWGNLVFESSTEAPFWDAAEAKDGVYYYIGSHQLKCTETQTTTVSGYVHLQR